MAHPILHISSWMMMIPHLLTVYWYSGPFILQWSYLCGPSTSVWNHGTTNIFALWSDRLMMTLGCMIDLCFMVMLPWREGIVVFVFTAAAVASYFCAKFTSGSERPLSTKGKSLTMKEIKLTPSLFHGLAHMFVSLSHFSMLYYYRHGSKGSIAEGGTTGNIFDYPFAFLIGTAPLIFYFICL